jgi:hypothetical protein
VRGVLRRWIEKSFAVLGLLLKAGAGLFPVVMKGKAAVRQHRLRFSGPRRLLACESDSCVCPGQHQRGYAEQLQFLYNKIFRLELDS